MSDGPTEADLFYLANLLGATVHMLDFVAEKVPAGHGAFDDALADIRAQIEVCEWQAGGLARLVKTFGSIEKIPLPAFADFNGELAGLKRGGVL